MNILLSSIGIIGGADGPTAIFVTASPDWWKYVLGAAVIVAAVVAMITFHRKKR